MATSSIPAPIAGTIPRPTLEAFAAAVCDCTNAAQLRALGIQIARHAQEVQALSAGTQPLPDALIIEARNLAPVILRGDAIGIRCVLLANDGRWRYRWSVDLRRNTDGTETTTGAHDWQCHRAAIGPGNAAWTPEERLPPADWFALHREALRRFCAMRQSGSAS